MFKTSQIYFLILFFLIYSCVDNATNIKPKDKKNGGTFVVETNLTFDKRFMKSKLAPYKMGESSYAHVFKSIFETLTLINPNTCQLEPGLAKRWKVNEDATEFTFFLRKNVYFHENNSDNSPLTATDVKNSFNELSISSKKSIGYAKIRDIIEGVTEYDKSVEIGKPLTDGVSGVQVINDSTLIFKLKTPYTPFPDVISNIDFSIFRKSMPDNINLGTGPFVFDTIKGDTLYLEKHNNYWKFDEDNNRLPYVDQLVFKRIYKLTIEERLEKFIHNETQLMRGILIDDISTLMRVLREENDIDFGYESIDESRLTAISFNTLTPPFNNVNVRKAFCYAFDRDLFIDSVLNGEQWAANNGLSPLEISQYDKKAKGLAFNLIKAKEFLAKAGYPNGKGFPTIELSVISAKHVYGVNVSKTEKVVMNMICENLNISYKLKEYDTFYSMFQDLWAGKGMVSIYNFTSRYPSPESYLNIFHLKIDSSEHIEHDNTMFFRDSIFDSFYSKALKEIDETKRSNLFYKAENRVMDLAPLLPIYHGESNRITSKNVSGLSEINNLGIVDYSKVYFIKEKSKENE